MAQSELYNIFDIFPEKSTVSLNGQDYHLYEYTLTDQNSDYFGLKIWWIKIPKEKVKFRIRETVDRKGSKSAYEENVDPGEILLVSGSFYDANNDPLGLIIIRRRERNPLWPSMEEGGILFQSLNKDHSIVHVKQWRTSRMSNINYAIQSQPLVVEEGVNGIENQRNRRGHRIAIGYTMNEELIVCGAYNPRGKGLNLYQFGYLMSAKEYPQGANCKVLLGLDGGPSAHAYFPQIKKRGKIIKNYHIGKLNNTAIVPNIIHFGPRE